MKSFLKSLSTVILMMLFTCLIHHQTPAQVFPSTNTTNLNIPDGGCYSYNSLLDTITVSGIPNNLGYDVILDSVCLTVYHPFDYEVSMSLYPPPTSGFPWNVNLVSNAGPSGANFINTCFSDDALTAIQDGSAPYTGAYKPMSAISNLNGYQPNGDWIINICDSAPLDSGYMVSWELRFRENTAYSCGVPTNLTATVINPYQVNIGVSQDSFASLIEFAISKNYNDFDSAEAGYIGSANHSLYIFTNVTPDNEYFYWVRTRCGSDTSAWVGPVTFNTYCTAQPGDSISTAKQIASFPYLDSENTIDCYHDVLPSTDHYSQEVIYSFQTGPNDYEVYFSTCSDSTEYRTGLFMYNDNADSVLKYQFSDFYCDNWTTTTVYWDVEPNTTYYLAVESEESSFGQGRYDLEADIFQCRSAKRIEGEVLSDTSLRVSWEPVLNAQCYLVYFDRDTASFENPTLTICSGDTSATFTGLDRGVYYRTYVRTICQSGDTSTFYHARDFEIPFYCIYTFVETIDTISHDVIGGKAYAFDEIREYLYKFGPNGFNPDTTAFISGGSSREFLLTGLEENTLYDIYTYSVCVTRDTSFPMMETVSTSCIGKVGDHFSNPFIVDAMPFCDTVLIDSCFHNYYDDYPTNDVVYRIKTGPNADSLTVSTCNSLTNFAPFMAVFRDDVDNGYSHLWANIFAGYGCTNIMGSSWTFDVDPNRYYYFIIMEQNFVVNNNALLKASFEEIALPCLTTRNLTETLASGTYKAGQKLIFSGNIPNGATVIFDAPEIEINANGTINGTLTTEEDGCN